MADWVHNLVIIATKKGVILICLDSKNLNKYLILSIHYTASREDAQHSFSDSWYFSTLDEKSEYWTKKLSKESQLLTTFITPFKKYCFMRLPFGLSVSSEVFCEEIDKAIAGHPRHIPMCTLCEGPKIHWGEARHQPPWDCPRSNHRCCTAHTLRPQHNSCHWSRCVTERVRTRPHSRWKTCKIPQQITDSSGNGLLQYQTYLHTICLWEAARLPFWTWHHYPYRPQGVCLESAFQEPISLAPAQLQWLLLRLRMYNLQVKYMKAKSVLLADTLSRLIQQSLRSM